MPGYIPSFSHSLLNHADGDVDDVPKTDLQIHDVMRLILIFNKINCQNMLDVAL